MNNKDKKKQRGQVLKRLREQRKESVQRTTDLIKDQNTIRKAIRQAMKDGPKTVPELARATDLPAPKVLWHVTAMKKHGHVVEAGMNDDYYQYQLSSG